MYLDVIHTIMRRSGAQIDLPDSTEHPVQLAEVTDLEDNISEVQLWCHVRQRANDRSRVCELVHRHRSLYTFTITGTLIATHVSYFM